MTSRGGIFVEKRSDKNAMNSSIAIDSSMPLAIRSVEPSTVALDGLSP